MPLPRSIWVCVAHVAPLPDGDAVLVKLQQALDAAHNMKFMRTAAQVNHLVKLPELEAVAKILGVTTTEKSIRLTYENFECLLDRACDCLAQERANDKQLLPRLRSLQPMQQQQQQ